MIRTFVHSVTGREIKVLDGTKVARLVVEDGDNWTEKGGSRGASNNGRRRSAPRKSTRTKRS